MQFPQSLRPERRQNSRISTICCDTLKCLEGNCMRNFSPADERSPQGLRTHIHTFTVNAFGDSPAALPRKTRPARPVPQQLREKLRPARLKTAFFARLGLQGELFRARTHCRSRRANFFAHSTRSRGNFETTNTFAGHAARPIETDNTFAGHAARPIETDNTFAGSKWPKNGLSSLAKAMAVSFRCKEVLAKVLSVS